MDPRKASEFLSNFVVIGIVLSAFSPFISESSIPSTTTIALWEIALGINVACLGWRFVAEKTGRVLLLGIGIAISLVGLTLSRIDLSASLFCVMMLTFCAIFRTLFALNVANVE